MPPSPQNYLENLHKILLNTRYQDSDQQESALESGITQIVNCIKQAKAEERSVYVIGNGGSAGIASHFVIDLVNTARLSAHCLQEPATLTCLSNDYGYESVYLKQLEVHIKAGDVLIAISSSGKSQNILHAVQFAKQKKASVITLSGFAENNPLCQSGQHNLYVNSKEYGPVEVAHMTLCHMISDFLLEH